MKCDENLLASYKNISLNNKDISINVSNEIGEFCLDNYFLSNGVSISYWNMEFKENIVFNKIQNDSDIWIYFCLGEGVSWLLDNKKNINLDKSESFIQLLYRNENRKETIEYRKGLKYIFWCIRVPKRYFFHNVEKYLEYEDVDSINRLLNEKRKFPIRSNFLKILLDIKNCNLSEKLKRSYYEIKINEILLQYLNMTIYEEQDKIINITEIDIESIKEIRHYIDENLENIENLSNLAKRSNMCVSKMCKLFKEIQGETICSYCTKRKVEKAKKIFDEGETNISNVAFQMGYSSSSYFSSIFKKHIGILPSKYIIENKKIR